MHDKFSGVAPAPIGAQIRKLRMQRGLTLSALAQKAGTSAPTLHRYESGWDRFEVGTLRRIAAALGAGLEIRFILPSREQRDRRPAAVKLVRVLAPLFWDLKLDVSHVTGNPRWVLGRVLMFGTPTQVRAARSFYGDGAIRDAVRQRGIDARTRNYWNLMLA